MLHAGSEIGDQHVPESGTVRVVDLTLTEVDAGVCRGDDGIVPAWEPLSRRIEDSGCQLVGLVEHNHERHDEDPTLNVTELQQPIARGGRRSGVPMTAPRRLLSHPVRTSAG